MKVNEYFETMKKRAEEGVKFSVGANEAYWVWYYNQNKKEIRQDGHLWPKDVHDFISTLRDAGIESFVTTETSTGLMELLHGFAAEGCTIKELCTITEDSGFKTEIKGIRIQIQNQ